MTLSIFMDINVFSLCLIGLSWDGSPGLQECPKKSFLPAMYSPLDGLWWPILKNIYLKKIFPIFHCVTKNLKNIILILIKIQIDWKFTLVETM